MAKFAIGDVGKTREGCAYEVISVSESFTHCRIPQPIRAKITNGKHVHQLEYFAEDGQYDTSPGGWDLMPPERSVTQYVALYTTACEQFEHEQALLFAQEMAVEKAKAAVKDARLDLRDALDGET